MCFSTFLPQEHHTLWRFVRIPSHAACGADPISSWSKHGGDDEENCSPCFLNSNINYILWSTIPMSMTAFHCGPILSIVKNCRRAFTSTRPVSNNGSFWNAIVTSEALNYTAGCVGLNCYKLFRCLLLHPSEYEKKTISRTVDGTKSQPDFSPCSVFVEKQKLRSLVLTCNATAGALCFSFLLRDFPALL